MSTASIGTSRRFHGIARYALWIVAALALIAIALWLGVPPLAKHLLETRLAAAISRPVTVTRIAFNPLELEARIEGLAIGARTPGAPPLLALDTATLDVSLASIWHRAPVLDRVALEHPRIAIVRNADGSYSVQDLIDAALADHEGPPARFSLNNIEVHAGEIDFDDRPKGRRHEVRDLNIGIPFLSSLPYQTTVKVAPHVAARVNGSPFGLAGTTTPFAREREASLDIDVDAMSLTQYLAYLPFKLRARIPAATLSSHAKLVFSEGDPGSRSLWLAGEFTLDRFVLQRADGADTLSIGRASAHVARLDVFNRTLVIDSLRVDKPVLDVRRAAGGAIDLAGPWVEAPPPAAPAAPIAATRQAPAPWRVDIEKAAISDGTIRVDDAAVKPAFRATYTAVTVDATDLSSASTKRAHVRATLLSDLGARASADVDVIPATLEASGHVAIDKLSLRRLYPYYAESLNLDVQDGALSLATDFSYVPDPRAGKLTLTSAEASLDDLRLSLAGERAPLWRVPRVRASGVTVDVAARRIEVASLASRGGTAALARGADGRINFARLLKTTTRAPVRVREESGTAGDTRAAAAASDATWLVAVKRMVFDGYTIDFADAAPKPAVALKLRNVEFVGEDLSNAPARRSRIRVMAATADGGRIAIEGPVTTQPLGAQLRIDASGLALAPLQPYVDPYVDVTVTGGTLAVNGRLDVGGAEGGADAALRTRFAGDVTVSGFGALDTPTHDELARWGKLTLAGVDVASEPAKLAIGAITLEDYFARVIVYDDATLNIVRLLKPQRAQAGGAVNAAAVPAVAAAAHTAAAGAPEPGPAVAGSARGLPVSIGKITLARGNVRYADFYIRPNYSADLADVEGTVSAMSATQAGTVDIAAKVARTAPVTVKGTLNPFARELSLDLAGTARDVDLPPLTPYSIKYAGYGITKGTLSFDVHYKVDNRKLSADNKLKVDQLTFGEHVDSPTATKLPVLLAVALLKDANGVIDIDLPIAGSLDDPQFSVGGLIVRVIVNLLTKAVTAPFALLGAAFGGGGEELSYIAFDPGTRSLPAAAAGKIDKLGKALAGRPSLKLDITGRSDTASDTEALRHEIVAHAIRAQKVKALVDAGTPPADAAAVVVAPDERVRFLLAAYKEAPIKERPRNFFGILKDVPPAEMEAMLYAHASAGADALRMLAQERAQAVKQALVAKGVAGERLFVVADAKVAQANDAPPTRVDLALK